MPCSATGETTAPSAKEAAEDGEQFWAELPASTMGILHSRLSRNRVMDDGAGAGCRTCTTGDDVTGRRRKLTHVAMSILYQTWHLSALSMLHQLEHMIPLSRLRGELDWGPRRACAIRRGRCHKKLSILQARHLYIGSPRHDSTWNQGLSMTESRIAQCLSVPAQFNSLRAEGQNH